MSMSHHNQVQVMMSMSHLQSSSSMSKTSWRRIQPMYLDKGGSGCIIRVVVVPTILTTSYCASSGEMPSQRIKSISFRFLDMSIKFRNSSSFSSTTYSISTRSDLTTFWSSQSFTMKFTKTPKETLFWDDAMVEVMGSRHVCVKDILTKQTRRRFACKLFVSHRRGGSVSTVLQIRLSTNWLINQLESGRDAPIIGGWSEDI